MKYTKTLAVIGMAALFHPQMAGAVSTTYSDFATFVADTGATSATGPLPNLGNVGTGPVTIGDLTLDSASGNLFVGGGSTVGDWTSRLAGNDIAISDLEHLDVTVNLAADTYAFGFHFVEPEFDPNLNATFVDSTFTVTLLAGAVLVDSFSFNAPNDTAAFVGVWSTDAFDAVEIRETTGGIGNEFFGEMYAGTRAASVPDGGATVGLLGLTLAGMMTLRKRMARG